MSSTAKLSYFWRSALKGIRHSPFVHLVAMCTIAIALFTTGLARSGVRMLDDLRKSLGGEVEVTVYLDDRLDPERGKALAQVLSERVGGEARYVPPELALGRLATELGEAGEALGALPDNPLPPSVELSVPDEWRDTSRLSALAHELRAVEGVSAVDYGEDAVARLEAISRALTVGSLVAFLVVVVATIIITSATLQLAIYARREEIEIQKLVGATNRFVKTPFLLEGLLQGMAGSAVAAGGLWAFGFWVGPRLEQLFAFLVGPGRTLALMDGRSLLEMLVIGCSLGLLGSFVAVGRFLRV
ncbi:MAG: ABC transporter permease [Myxococcaceae bacterium]